jgi:hypothetical protein
MTLTSTVYLWMAYPIPASTVTHSIGLGTADQRLDLVNFWLSDRLALGWVDACQKICPQNARQ